MGAAWQAHLASHLEFMGFQQSFANCNVRLKPNSFKDGRKYYTYIFVHVDDILILDKAPLTFMNLLKAKFIVRENTIKVPDFYLGTNISRIELTQEEQNVGAFHLINMLRRQYPMYRNS